jgi:hypothetical protein
VSFGQIFLAASDVDAGVFRNLAGAYHAVAHQTTVYVSSKNQALASPGALHYYPGVYTAITIIPAIDTIEASNVDISLLGHGYFAEARNLLHANLEGKPPPRFGLLPIQTIEGQAYGVSENDFISLSLLGLLCSLCKFFFVAGLIVRLLSVWNWHVCHVIDC